MVRCVAAGLLSAVPHLISIDGSGDAAARRNVDFVTNVVVVVVIAGPRGGKKFNECCQAQRV